MSRIGKAPIHIPPETSVTVNGQTVVVKGPKGELTTQIPAGIKVEKTSEDIHISRKSDDTRQRAIHGFVRAKLANDVAGVTTGWSKTLELSGVGYRANLSGANLVLTVGFSHPVTITPASGIAFSIVEGKIIISGIDKHLVGQVAASIRAVKEPEPYKGKGISYTGEHIRRKAGKAAKAVGGAVAGGGGK